MSIEAMKQAIEALEHAEKDSADFQCINTDQTSAAIAALRTAIQQNEARTDVRCEGCGYMTHHREHMGCVRAAKQHTHPATGEPIGYMNAGNIHELKQGALPYGYVYPQKESGVSVPVYAHPAPSVPDGLTLVPSKLTQAMADAALKFETQGSGIQGGDLDDVWQAILAAKEAP